jgi:surface antigen
VGQWNLCSQTWKLAWLASLAACTSGVLAACTSGVNETVGSFPALDAAAQARRYNAMEQAFENNVSGRAAFWSENGRVQGTVMPFATLRTTLYGWCREYEERITTSFAKYHLVGIACRTSNGQWLVVDIHSYVEDGRQNS